jgi:hypothetical protein
MEIIFKDNAIPGRKPAQQKEKHKIMDVPYFWLKRDAGFYRGIRLFFDAFWEIL